MDEAKGRKLRVLAYCDSPTCATGFGTVSRNIFEGLYKTGRYEIDILGINYWGDPHNFPYRIWPTGTNQDKDPYGRRKICNMIPSMEYDILFFLQDTFILDFLPELIPHLERNNKAAPTICYFPIDGKPKEQWIKNISVIDNIVAYSEFGKKEAEEVFPPIKDKNMSVINHGVNTSNFHILPEEQVKEFRQRYFDRHADKFIFTNLNRNQQRKDIPRTLAAFAEFRKQVPDSILYLHMAKVDQGWNLPEVCKGYGFSTSEDVIFPENFGPNQGYPLPIVNMLYNCSDCIVSTTLGEGWGLSWSEAMAVKKPVIMPANTAFLETINEDIGWLVKSGSNPSLWTVVPHDNEVIRPLVDVDDMVRAMLEVYNNPEEVKRRTENAYKYVTQQLDWQGPIAKQWVKLFDKAYKDWHKKEAELLDGEVKSLEEMEQSLKVNKIDAEEL